VSTYVVLDRPFTDAAFESVVGADQSHDIDEVIGPDVVGTVSTRPRVVTNKLRQSTQRPAYGTW